MKKILLSLIVLTLFTLPQWAEAKALCSVGDKAQVLWGGKWWPATVLAVNPSGNKCKIHYKGYGSNWDEWVGAGRIKIVGNAPAAAPGQSSYATGQSVKALWGGKWWNAQILKTKGNRFYIKYDGYSSKWNEWVGVNRLKPK